MAEAKTRLRLRRVDRIALVDKGDNPRAVIAFHKRAPDAAAQDGVDAGLRQRVSAAFGRAFARLFAPEIEKAMDAQTFDETHGQSEFENAAYQLSSDLHQSLRSIVASDAENKAALIETSIDQFASALKEKLGAAAPAAAPDTPPAEPAAPVEQQVEPQNADTDEDEDDEEAMAQQTQKAANTDVSKAETEALRKRLADAEAEIRKMQLDARNAEYVAKAQRLYPSLPVKAEELGPVLRKIADGEKLSDGELKLHERALAAGNEAAHTARLFQEIGSGVADEGSATAKADALATELRKADPKLTQEQALAKVYKSDPDLRREIEAEERALRGAR